LSNYQIGKFKTMLKFGIISEVDATKGLARVQFPDADGIVSNWLPMSVSLTLKDKASIPFFVNEHVWCLMDDNLEYGVIGGAIYSTADTPGSLGSADIVGVQFAQGLRIEYTRSTRILSITGSGKVNVNVDDEVDITSAQKVKVTGTNDIEITSATKVKITGPTEVDITSALTKITGAVQVVGEITAGGITIQTGLGAGSGKMMGDGDIQTTGKITGAEVHEGTIQLGTHKHSGVTTGSGTSGTPTP
jgi:phage baseplate assembly protein V